jgi:hypothetical protein
MQIPIIATNYLLANEIVKHSNNKWIQVPSDHTHSSRETWHPHKGFRDRCIYIGNRVHIKLDISTKIWAVLNHICQILTSSCSTPSDPVQFCTWSESIWELKKINEDDLSALELTNLNRLRHHRSIMGDELTHIAVWTSAVLHRRASSLYSVLLRQNGKPQQSLKRRDHKHCREPWKKSNRTGVTCEFRTWKVPRIYLL